MGVLACPTTPGSLAHIRCCLHLREVVCCGDLGDPCTDGRWSTLPEFVSHTAGIPSQHVGSLPAFWGSPLKGGYRLVVQHPQGGQRVPALLLGFCYGQAGSVGDEFHFVSNALSKRRRGVCMLLTVCLALGCLLSLHFVLGGHG